MPQTGKPPSRTSQDQDAERKQLEVDVLQFQARAAEYNNARFGSGFETFIRNIDEDVPLDYWHIKKVVTALDKAERGEIKRLMIFMPPRHYKTVTVSKLFPAYFLYKNPKKRVILASYSADLATDASRKARDNYRQTGRLLSEESAAAHAWDTTEGGGFYSAGIGGTITGKGGHIIILDDAIKEPEEAYNPSFRNKQWQWWTWVLSKRKERNAVIVIMFTRWHLDDIAGRLLESEKIAPEHWHIINLQGLKEGKQTEFPPTCTVEDDPRGEGEALCPGIQNKQQLEHERALDSASFQALIQQDPSKESGDIWKREWFENHVVPDYQFDNLLPTLKDYGADWDTAYTKDETNSASAMCKAGVSIDGNIYVDAIEWRWLEFPDLVNWMMEVPCSHFVEAKASGKSAVQSLMKVGIFASEVQVKGGNDKIARARLASPVVSQGRVFVRASILNRLLDDPKQGLIRFPSGAGTEGSDVFSQMLSRLWPYTVQSTRKPTAKEIWEQQVAAGERGEDLRYRSMGAQGLEPPPEDWRTKYL